MLDEKMIEENQEKFVQIFTEHIHREGADNLLDWLINSDYFVAPASSKFHSAYEGGLCQHSLNVFDRFVRDYKGNGRQFSIEFQQNFPVLAEKTYIKSNDDNKNILENQELSEQEINIIKIFLKTPFFCKHWYFYKCSVHYINSSLVSIYILQQICCIVNYIIPYFSVSEVPNNPIMPCII